MIELFTAGTPNGHKIAILLEELAVPYRCVPIDLAANEQKRPEFLALNPNGKIPVIVDHQPAFQVEPWVVFESGAILLYLAEKYGRFLPHSPSGKSLVMQWLMFQVGGLGPMMGQSNVFRHYAPQKIEYAIERYRKETRRLLEVLDSRLRVTPYVAGEYSIADMALFPWARGHEWSGTDINGLDALADWLARIEARPAVVRGVQVPTTALGGDLKTNPAATIRIAQNMLI